MKLSVEQTALLDALRESHATLARKRTTLRAEIERELERQLDVLYTRRSKVANECFAAGISKTKIGRAMGTSDWKTISDILAKGEEERTLEQQLIDARRGYILEDLDAQGSPGAIVFPFYKAKGSGEVVRGPLRIALKKLFGGPLVDWVDTEDVSMVEVGFLYDALQKVNERFREQDDDPEPTVLAATGTDDFRGRFFVPDDEEDED